MVLLDSEQVSQDLNRRFAAPFAGQIHLAVMAVLCGLRDFQPNGIIRAVFIAGVNQDTNSIYQKFVDFGAKDAFWAMAAQR